MAKSVYIHIPFCKQKCKYCSFVSFTNLDLISSYVTALLTEIDRYYCGEELTTLYFGGGTPSLLKIELIKEIIKKFHLTSNTEVTFELNPDDVSLTYLDSLRKCGINRLSIGAQTFDNKTLALIGRRHNVEQTINAVKLAKKVGFENISLDLIYGLPNTNFKNDLKHITELEVQHVSTYGLKIEEGSYWGKFIPQNLPNDDEQADMYIFIHNYLEDKGYKRYEISNFALCSYESKHNLNYWNNAEYYGFGVSAHGYVNGVRYANTSSFDKYIKNPIVRQEEHSLTINEKIEEEIFLGLRKEAGINIIDFKAKYNLDFERKYQFIIDKFYPKYLIKDCDCYKLTIDGVLLSNNIMAEFLE